MENTTVIFSFMFWVKTGDKLSFLGGGEVEHHRFPPTGTHTHPPTQCLVIFVSRTYTRTTGDIIAVIIIILLRNAYRRTFAVFAAAASNNNNNMIIIVAETKAAAF